MQIKQIYTKSHLRNFTYLIHDSKEAYCIDPFNAEQVKSHLKDLGLKLKVIINTHEHFDHYCGNEGLQIWSECEVWAHQNAKGKIPGVTRFLKKDEVINLNEKSYLHVLDTPGHTMAHLCFLMVKDEKPYAVFTGDTLFNAGVGNCHNGGDPEVLYETISHQFQVLPGDVRVYPGHDYIENNLRFTLDREPQNSKAGQLLDTVVNEYSSDKNFFVSSIAVEKEVNTFMRLDNQDIRSKLTDEQKLGGEMSDKHVFLSLRQLRDRW